MKLTIKANNKINNVKVVKNSYNNQVESVVIDFELSDIWTDLELWLTEAITEKYRDYAKLNVSERKKMKFTQ